MDDVNKQRRSLFLFLNLDTVPRNSISGGFTYNWQSKWVGIIATKTERTQIHFLSHVLVALRRWILKTLVIYECSRISAVVASLHPKSNFSRHLQQKPKDASAQAG